MSHTNTANRAGYPVAKLGKALALISFEPNGSVLELSAGVSLPGVVAARCGADVILSDAADKPSCLENCRRSCEANALRGVAVVGLSWGEVSPDLVLLPELDVILGSDVFYDPEDFEDVLVTVVFLLRKNPKAEFWTTYQVRSADWSIEVLLHRWSLSCADIQLQHFDADRSELGGSTLPGNHSIQMMKISLKTEDVGRRTITINCSTML
ncbi:methyltransferase-like protein 23 [Archocentrus centrarchus]|uniref:methyltransferase-like protein 23 n=1 Tax=Archocentrus centrarchus TaxID=63155 RepID=UPI0011EA4369|nr:methyltransferase-like protein 23 [Archocentrus centrarchus]